MPGSAEFNPLNTNRNGRPIPVERQTSPEARETRDPLGRLGGVSREAGGPAPKQDSIIDRLSRSIGLGATPLGSTPPIAPPLKTSRDQPATLADRVLGGTPPIAPSPSERVNSSTIIADQLGRITDEALIQGASLACSLIGFDRLPKGLRDYVPVYRTAHAKHEGQNDQLGMQHWSINKRSTSDGILNGRTDGSEDSVLQRSTVGQLDRAAKRAGGEIEFINEKYETRDPDELLFRSAKTPEGKVDKQFRLEPEKDYTVLRRVPARGGNVEEETTHAAPEKVPTAEHPSPRPHEAERTNRNGKILERVLREIAGEDTDLSGEKPYDPPPPPRHAPPVRKLPEYTGTPEQDRQDEVRAREREHNPPAYRAPRRSR